MSAFIGPNFGNMPIELRKLPRWVTWNAEGKPGEKPRKVPYSPTGRGKPGSSTDPATWGSFAQAEASYRSGGRTGVGIVLNGDGLVGVDIDHCVTDGKPSPESMALLNRLGAGYIEISPSGTGLRAVGYGEQLEAGVNGSRDGLKAEFYSTGRYLTLTGKTIKAGPIVPLKDFKATAESFRLAKKTKVDKETGEYVQTPADERHAALVKAILSGDVYHDSLRDLAASLVASGMAAGAVVNHLRGLMDLSEGPHDDRWQSRKGQIKDLVTSAVAKFKPTSAAEDFDDLLKAASDKFDGAKAGATDAASDGAAETPEPEQPQGASEDATAKPRYKMLTAADLNALPPLRWRIRDVLPETGLSMLLGASTAGKTFVALDMAAHVSLGMAWHGFKTYAAPVVYVGLEGEQGIQRRIRAWKQHYEMSLPDTLRFVLQPFNMLQLTNVADLAAAVLDAGGRGGIIIVDTLNRATPGADENSSVDMGNTIAAAKKLQAATSGMVMLVHHKGKNDAAGARGHSSLYGALDAAIAVNSQGALRSWSTDPAKGGKAKDGEAVTKSFDLQSVPLGVDDDLSPINSAVVVPCATSTRPGKPLSTTQKCALDAYHAAAPVSGLLDADGEFAGLHADHWRAAFYTASTADTPHAKKVAFQRVRNELVKLEQVAVMNDVYRLAGAGSFMESGFAAALREKAAAL